YLYASGMPTALIDPLGLLSAKVRACVCLNMWRANYQAATAWTGALNERKAGNWNDQVLRPCENYLYAFAAIRDYGDPAWLVRAGIYLHDWSKILPRQTSPRSPEAKKAGLEGVTDAENGKDWSKDCDPCKRDF